MQSEKNGHTPSVLIIGGGFAGIAAARKLAASRTKLNVTLISNKTYFEYYPGLYRIVTGSAPIEVCVPLRDMLPTSVDILAETIVRVDVAQKTVYTESSAEYSADYLILALGSQTNYFGLPGIPDLSFGFKSVGEALRLKNHIHGLFAEHLHPSVSELVSHFHIVIVGAGPTGVEVAGDLSRYLEKLSIKHKVDPSFMTIDIIDRNSRVLSNIHPKASERALARLRKLGINIFLNRTLMSEEIEQVYLKDMSLKSKTVIWTAGVQINQLYTSNSDIKLTDRKRVVVTEHLELVGNDGVYVVGDAADTKYSGLAQTAIRDGKFVGTDILRRIIGAKRLPYVPASVGYVIPIGKHWAVMSLGPFRLYGLFAYLSRHAIDFFYFAGILPPRKLFSLFFQGFKYR